MYPKNCVSGTLPSSSGARGACAESPPSGPCNLPTRIPVPRAPSGTYRYGHSGGKPSGNLPINTQRLSLWLAPNVVAPEHPPVSFEMSARSAFGTHDDAGADTSICRVLSVNRPKLEIVSSIRSVRNSGPYSESLPPMVR